MCICNMPQNQPNRKIQLNFKLGTENKSNGKNINPTDRCKCDCIHSNKVFVGDDWSSFGAFTSVTHFFFVRMRGEKIFLCWLNDDSLILNGIISFQGSFFTEVFYVIWKINLWKSSRSLKSALSKESKELLYRCASCHVTFFLVSMKTAVFWFLDIGSWSANTSKTAASLLNIIWHGGKLVPLTANPHLLRCSIPKGNLYKSNHFS